MAIQHQVRLPRTSNGLRKFSFSSTRESVIAIRESDEARGRRISAALMKKPDRSPDLPAVRHGQFRS